MSDSRPFPMAYFGEVSKRLADWRKTEDVDPDDEQVETPPDVVEMLGFDPAAADQED